MRDLTRSVFEKSAMKLMSLSISNGRIQTSNEYLQMIEDQQMNVFRDGSDTYLTEEQVWRYLLLG
jgi:hypothetical protein